MVYQHLSQVVTPITAAVSGVISFVEQRNTSSGTWYVASGLANAFLLIPDGF